MERLLQGKGVVVYGLGKSGIAAVRLLAGAGARITAIDARTEAELGEALTALRAEGVKLVLGGSPGDLLDRAHRRAPGASRKANLRRRQPRPAARGGSRPGRIL